MRRRITAPHPLVLAAVAGAALGLIAAVLVLTFGDPPGSRRAYAIFYTISLPVSAWLGSLTWSFGKTAVFLTVLPLNGAVWGMALTVFVRGMLRSTRARRVTLASVLAGTVLAVLVWIAGFPVYGPYDGARGLIVLAQIPGIMLLGLNGYDTMMYDGTFVEDLYRPGPVTLLLFSLANALLAAGFVVAARFTWRWIRAPLPRPSPVAHR